MRRVLNTYAAKKTSFGSSEDGVGIIELPAFTFCFKPMIKPSLRKSYNMTSTFCSKPHLYMEFIEKMNTPKNNNITWNEFCKNISYQLNRDFTVILQKYNGI